jgi:hypothetical protein
MTVEWVLKSFEGYYTDTYGPDGSKIMSAYLGKLDPDLLPYVYSEALKTIGRNFKRAPGIAELERVKQKARDEKKSEDARKAALAAPDRLQIAEDLADPQDIAAILGKLAAAKGIEGESC